MLNIGLPEIVIILVLALLVFGPKKLPEIGKSLGQTLKEVKRASNDIINTANSDLKESNEEETDTK